MDDEGHAVDTGFLRELEEKIGMNEEKKKINLDEIIQDAGKFEDVNYPDVKFEIDINYPQMFPFVLCCGITSKPQPGDITLSINVHNGIPPEFPRVGKKGTDGGSPRGVGSPDSSELSGGDTQPSPKRQRSEATYGSHWHALSLLMDIAHLLSVEDVGARRDARSSVGDALEVLVEQRQP